MSEQINQYTHRNHTHARTRAMIYKETSCLQETIVGVAGSRRQDLFDTKTTPTKIARGLLL